MATIVNDRDVLLQAASPRNLSQDNLLTPIEKPAIVKEYTTIINEQTGIDSEATAFGITTEKTAYDNAITALTTYLGTLTGWNTIPGVNVAIVGTTFRQKFTDVYAAKSTLLNKIYASAQTLANNASSAAAAAQSDATSALSQLSDISSDNKLTPSEKPTVRNDWNIVSSEKSVLDTQATAFGVTTEKTTYDNAFQTLATYLNAGTTYTSGVPSWISDANLSSTTVIVGSTFRSNWQAYYDARTALLNKIATIASTLATWSNVTGTGKPDDNAQVNAPGLGIKINQNTFSASSGGSCYIHGFDTTGTAADQNGYTVWLGAKITITKQAINFSASGQYFILYDIAGRNNWNGKSLAGASKVGNVWTYNVGGTTGTVTVDSNVIVIGSGNNTSSTVVSHAEIWTTAAAPATVKGTIDTTDINANAATDVVVTTASNVALTYFSTTETTVATISYTAVVTGSVTVTVAMRLTNTGHTIGGGGGPYVVNSGIRILNATDSTASQTLRIPNVNLTTTGSTSDGSVALSTLFSLTAGTTYSFQLRMYNQCNGSDTTVNTAEMRLEALKR